jgi:hypothetical protein
MLTTENKELPTCCGYHLIRQVVKDSELKREGLNPRIHCGESIPQKELDINEGN